MTRTLLRFITIAGLGASVFATMPPAGAQEEFDVGVVAALSGAFASGSKDIIEGLNVWIKDHAPKDKKIVLKIEDDETNPVSAQNVFRKLASDNSIHVIMMFSNSNAGMAIKPFASEFKVPIISAGASDTLGKPADPYLFKVSPTTLDNMRALAGFAKKRGWTKIAHIHGTDDFGQLESRNLNALSKEYGLTLVDQESVAIDATNFTTELGRMVRAKPDLIYSSLAGRTEIIFYTEWRQRHIKIPLSMTTAGVSHAFLQAIGGPQNAAGIYTVTQIGTLGERIGGATAAYYKELAHSLGKTPSYFDTFGFDSGLMLGYALAHSDGSRAGIRDALDRVKDMPAINGFVTFTATNHTGQDQRAVTMGVLNSAGGLDPALQSP